MGDSDATGEDEIESMSEGDPLSPGSTIAGTPTNSPLRPSPAATATTAALSSPLPTPHSQALSGTSTATAGAASAAASPTQLTQEQLALIDAKRQAALAKRQARRKASESRQGWSGPSTDAAAVVEDITVDTTAPTTAAGAPPSKGGLPPLSAEQELVLHSVARGQNVFITGSAGVGKSVVLQHIIQQAKAMHGGGAVFITAPTGVAAANVNGTTLHSFSGIGLGDECLDLLCNKVYGHSHRRGSAYERWRNCKVLIIDEISMVDARLFSVLDDMGRRMRRKPHATFGGIQVVVCGDFYQLSPVPDKFVVCPNCGKKYHQRSIPWGQKAFVCKNSLTSQDRPCHQVFDPTTRMAFEADPLGRNKWNDCAFRVFNLKQVFRQKDDKFVRALNKIRVGVCDDESYDLLSQCRRPLPKQSINGAEIGTTRLFSHNRDVDHENHSHYSRMPGPEVVYDSSDRASQGSAPNLLSTMRRDCQAPAQIKLKKNTPVILLCNLNTETGLVNGSRGMVLEFVAQREAEDNRTGLMAMVRDSERRKQRQLGLDYEEDLDVDIGWVLRNGSQKLLPKVFFPASQQTIVIKPHAWRRGLDEHWAERAQIPLKFAWALSVHKCQGLTLEYVEMNLGQAFAHGQVYVALSRAKNLSTLQIRSFDRSRVQADSRVCEFYDHLDNKQRTQAEDDKMTRQKELVREEAERKRKEEEQRLAEEAKQRRAEEKQRKADKKRARQEAAEKKRQLQEELARANQERRVAEAKALQVKQHEEAIQAKARQEEQARVMAEQAAGTRANIAAAGAPAQGQSWQQLLALAFDAYKLSAGMDTTPVLAAALQQHKLDQQQREAVVQAIRTAPQAAQPAVPGASAAPPALAYAAAAPPTPLTPAVAPPSAFAPAPAATRPVWVGAVSQPTPPPAFALAPAGVAAVPQAAPPVLTAVAAPPASLAAQPPPAPAPTPAHAAPAAVTLPALGPAPTAPQSASAAPIVAAVAQPVPAPAAPAAVAAPPPAPATPPVAVPPVSGDAPAMDSRSDHTAEEAAPESEKGTKRGPDAAAKRGKRRRTEHGEAVANETPKPARRSRRSRKPKKLLD